jgi:hypothetical protein
MTATIKKLHQGLDNVDFIGGTEKINGRLFSQVATAKPTTFKLLEIKRFLERYASEHVDSSRTLRS